MKNLILFFALFLAIAAQADDLNFAHYHSQADIHNYLAASAKNHPDLVKFYNLGKSLQGRDIDYAVVTRGDAAGKPAVYFNGTHHGDEWSATEGILGLMDRLISHASDPAISQLLDQYAIYLQPLVNPDGHAAQTREDSQGRDPNRDYSSTTKTDAESFALPEIRLVKKLVDTIHPVAAAAYHSGIEEVLWSWCNTSKAAKDAAKLSALGKVTAQAMSMDRFLQSYDDYATDGEFIDYAYMKYGTLALTFEVSDIKTPAESQLAQVVDRSVAGALAMIENIRSVNEAPFVFGFEKSYGTRGSQVWAGRKLE